jgi:hypothetical protein
MKCRELRRIFARVFNVFVTWHIYSEPQACPIPEVRSAQAMYVRYCAIPVRTIAARQGQVKSTGLASNTAW